MRGQVKKYLPLFQRYVAEGRTEQVISCLKTGKGLKVPLNGKDRREMLTELGLTVKS